MQALRVEGGQPGVQEVFAVRQLHHRKVRVVMTSSFFTHGVRELADATGVALWDRNAVLSMIAVGRASGRM